MLGNLWIVLLAISLAAQTVLTQKSASKHSLTARVDESLRPYADTNNFTGVVMVSRDGRVLFAKGYGMANYELDVPNTPKMRFHVASVSKTFTSAAILMLEERGKLNSSDPVAKFLPDYPNGDKLRIEHLLKHTSGIMDTGGLAEWGAEERKPHTAAELVALFKDKPLRFEPGSKYSYSNSNYNLLALIIEKVSGQGYGDFLRQNIFEPLGLRATLHDSDAAKLIPDRASGTEPDGVSGVRLPRYVDWSARTGNGSLATTTADLDKFVTAVLGGKLLKPSSLAKIMQPAEGFAYGWVRTERFGRKQIRTGGRSPGFNASVERYLDDGTTIIVLSNSYSPVAQDSAFLDALHSAVFDKPVVSPAIRPIPVAPGGLAQFVGRYQMPHNYFAPDAVINISDRGDHLDAAWSGGGVNTILPVGTNQFLDRNFWGRISFNRDARGVVNGFVYEIADQKFLAAKVAP